MADWLEEGAKAPSFTLADDKGNKIKLSQFSGKPLVIYFYPRTTRLGAPKKLVPFGMRANSLRAWARR